MFSTIRVGAAAALAMISVAAQAADMPGLPPPLPHPLPPPPSFWSDVNWYARGDIGWRWGAIGTVDAPGPADPSGNKLGDGLTAGGGIGLKTRFMRTDFTIDYALPVKYSGSVATADDTTAKISSLNLLFNGYFDLGTWYGLTPYVGAGAGAALINLADFQSTALPPSADNSDWHFAWAAMAGVAWAVTPNMQIDFGYRYLDVGKVHGGAPGEVTFNNIAGHEVRVGVRWNFDDMLRLR
jgi:opacity protein-like surface antigen